MTQPTPYERGTSFTDFSTEMPDAQQPGVALEQAAKRGAAKAYREWLVKHDTASRFGGSYD